MVTFLERSLADPGEFAVADSVLRGMIRKLETVHGPGRVPALLAFMYAQQKIRLGELDSAEAWIAPAMRDTTSGAGLLNSWLPIALAELHLSRGRLAELHLSRGRLAEARVAVARIPRRTRGQRATAAMLQAWLSRAEGDTAGATALLELELRTLHQDGQRSLAQFAMPLVSAGEWRLVAGDARGADSIARVARDDAELDSLARSRSALVGRAGWLETRARLQLGDSARARKLVEAAIPPLRFG